MTDFPDFTEKPLKEVILKAYVFNNKIVIRDMKNLIELKINNPKIIEQWKEVFNIEMKPTLVKSEQKQDLKIQERNRLLDIANLEKKGLPVPESMRKSLVEE